MYQGKPTRGREQDVAAQPGDGVRSDAAAAVRGGRRRQAAHRPAGGGHRGRNGTGRHPLLPAAAAPARRAPLLALAPPRTHTHTRLGTNTIQCK